MTSQQETLNETLRNDMKDAMRAKDQIRLDTIRSVLSAATNELVTKGRTPQDQLSSEELLTVIRRLAKQRRESAEAFRNGGRSELAEKEEKELAIISQYLPPEMGRDEIEKIAREEKEALQATDLSMKGRLIGAIMKRTNGQANAQTVSEVVSSLF